MDRTNNMSMRGVRVSALKKFCREIMCVGQGSDRWTTADVVSNFVKPKTQETRCRYVDLMHAEDVGKAHFFASHTWKAPFRDLVAAIAAVAGENAEGLFVWIECVQVGVCRCRRTCKCRRRQRPPLRLDRLGASVKVLWVQV